MCICSLTCVYLSGAESQSASRYVAKYTGALGASRSYTCMKCGAFSHKKCPSQFMLPYCLIQLAYIYNGCY